MNLTHSFDIPADLATAWGVLLDIPRIAPCLPGAELSELVGERTYKGLARVKVGPIGLQFAGEAEIVDVDVGAHKAIVHAKGADAKGRGTADATIRFALSPEDQRKTRVAVETDLNLTGAVAQYGRASGLIDAVAKQIIADFVENLEAELARSDRPDSVERQAPEDVEAASAAPKREATPPGPTTPTAAAPISGLRLLFKALAAIIGGWFKKREA